jgi:hypothetical protein
MTTLRMLTAIAALGVAAAAPAADPAGPRTFATPREAADALVAAAAAQDVAALLALFGRDGTALVVSGDEVQDRNDREKFVEDAREKMDVAVDPKDPRRAGIRVGNEAWPFPVPIVEKAGKWSFAGRRGSGRWWTGGSARTSSTPSRSAGATSRPRRSTPRRTATATGRSSTPRR